MCVSAFASLSPIVRGSSDFGRAMGGVILNEDCTQFYVTMNYPATIEGICRYTDECYLPPGHQVRIMMLNPQAQRSSYNAMAMEPMWKNVIFDETTGIGTYMGNKMDAVESEMVRRMKAFADRGEDQYVHWIDHLRKRGVSPWLSMRMNDDHNKPIENTDWYLNSPLWRDHPEWHIASHNRGGYGAGDRHQGLDYGQPEVFEYHLRIAFELIDRYDGDGFEMDFMRHGRFFRHGQEAKGREILNDFVRRVREHANAKAAKTGHPYHIAVRVHADPRDAWYQGIDAETWCKEKLVDMVIPSSFFQTTWNNVPVREWRRIVGEDVILAPCLETFKNPTPGTWGVKDARIDHAFAASWLHQGADVIYLFNHFGIQSTTVTSLDSLEHAAALPRRNIVTFNDTRAEGFPIGNPLPCKVFECYSLAGVFRLECGPKPQAPNQAYVALASCGDLPMPKVWLNSYGPLKPVDVPAELTFEKNTKNVLAFSAPLELLNDGDNLLEITDPEKEFELDWVEIYYTGTVPAPGK